MATEPCSQCGFLNQPDGVRCFGCGHPLTRTPEEVAMATEVCPACGFINQSNGVTCFGCGRPKSSGALLPLSRPVSAGRYRSASSKRKAIVVVPGIVGVLVVAITAFLVWESVSIREREAEHRSKERIPASTVENQALPSSSEAAVIPKPLVQLPAYAKELSNWPGIDPSDRLIVMVYTRRKDPASLWKVADVYRAHCRYAGYGSLDISFFVIEIVTDKSEWSALDGRELTTEELDAADYANYLWEGGDEESIMIDTPSGGRKEIRRK